MNKEQIIADLNELFKQRKEFYAFFDAKIPKKEGLNIFDFEKLDDANLRDFHKLFHRYDYAIRKLLPRIYKAYDIDMDKDLSKDF
ncbi:hypothetical protein DMB95_08235 [Campylobacter sp. MIT 12-8780]|uniref:CmeU family protein n=1 Tax=unclassified Campylobacter TaxID=2593542 RepID=UPI0010F52BCE|nr:MULTISPECIES: CmeU family protein [unclassified Campylobacter]NDJ27416.1 hypothetical protein [Campylobacter sp. MIT 19-121]TKX28545.1 hypothetical protein CQA38_07665 [Campylobacter sp. MIT 12-5580]TQR40193.1 hypothetical protein DMB95_08235 [Campylobacter sp. MIT 12-8780]